MIILNKILRLSKDLSHLIKTRGNCIKQFLKRFGTILTLAVLLMATVNPVVLGAAFEPDYTEENDVATADEGMVVSAHPLASETGYDILAKGGNAMDAAFGLQ